jgi:ATP phosphoribosyltransferase
MVDGIGLDGIVETGRTLHANGLIAMEVIASFEADSIVNRASQWINSSQIDALVAGTRGVLDLQKEESPR